MADPIRQAVAHFQGGRFAEARALLEPLRDAAGTPAPALMMLAVACRRLGNAGACGAALDRLLEAQPRAVRALAMKAELAAEAGDERAAIAFYKRALAEAPAQPNLPADLKADLERGRAWTQAAEARQWQRLQERLDAAGASGDAAPPRFRQSVELLSGEKQIYFQQPGLYYFPELPQKQYYEREAFDWAPALEARTGEILEEAQKLLAERSLFAPYLVSDPRRPPSSYHGMADNPDWSSLYLWSEGRAVADNVRRCPATAAALEQVPLARISVRAPVVMFSLLAGGAKIPPHHGSTNVRLICHLPLVVPPGCGFRVGNEVRQWEVGKLLIFDDSIEHEAWNDSGEDRLILIFDIWRPELDEAERAAVAALFDALDRP